MGWVLFWEGLKGSRWATRQGCLQGHCQLNGHEFEQAPVDGEGQGSLAYNLATEQYVCVYIYTHL